MIDPGIPSLAYRQSKETSPSSLSELVNPRVFIPQEKKTSDRLLDSFQTTRKSVVNLIDIIDKEKNKDALDMLTDIYTKLQEAERLVLFNRQ